MGEGPLHDRLPRSVAVARKDGGAAADKAVRRM
jgi:hypothetical protein